MFVENAELLRLFVWSATCLQFISALNPVVINGQFIDVLTIIVLLGYFCSAFSNSVSTIVCPSQML